jgi:hypothetical protein
MVHRLDPTQIQQHAAPASRQFDPGPSGLRIQVPDDAGVPIGDAEA